MSERELPPHGHPDAEREELPSIPPDPELDNLLRRALPDPAHDVDLLGSVQRKLRERSGGKFYEDGWSVSKHPPVARYLITSLFMLAIVGVLYSMLFSFAGEPKPVKMDPPPIQVLPP